VHHHAGRSASQIEQDIDMDALEYDSDENVFQQENFQASDFQEQNTSFTQEMRDRSPTRGGALQRAATTHDRVRRIRSVTRRMPPESINSLQVTMVSCNSHGQSWTKPRMPLSCGAL